MVEYKQELNNVFGSLSDSTRRDILKRISKRSMSVGEIAAHYELSFAAIAKHLEVLQRAKLITKTRRGKQQVITISPKSLAVANDFLEGYRELWESRLDSLGEFLNNLKTNRR